MVRRLVETLIIELYEAKGKQSEIQDGAGNYLMLSHLVDRVLAETSWILGRETKQALPIIKNLEIGRCIIEDTSPQKLT